MSKLISLVLALMMLLFSFSAFAEGDALFTPGTYEAEGKGFGGAVKVSVTVSENEITEVTAAGEAETPALGGVAIQTLPGEIVKAQTPNVDMLSGATVTSTAIIAAATEALKKANIETNSWFCRAAHLFTWRKHWPGRTRRAGRETEKVGERYDHYGGKS